MTGNSTLRNTYSKYIPQIWLNITECHSWSCKMTDEQTKTKNEQFHIFERNLTTDN